ncbi:MAG: alpha/beta fold hydrolase [Bacteroidota bacterium]
MLHGFGDSGLACIEVFESSLTKDFNIYVVDLPGFGVSPVQPTDISIKAQAQLLSKIIANETTNQGKVSIVAIPWEVSLVLGSIKT